MSIQAVAWALEQDVEDRAAKLVLIGLANAYNQQRGRCFPTIRQLMKEASASERTIQRKLRVLVALGLIRIVGTNDETGRQQANEYLLDLKGEGVTLTGGGCQIDGGEGVTGDGGEGVSCDTPTKEPEETPEERTLGASAPKASDEPEGFEEFWKAYPKREGPNPKKPARLAYARLLAKGALPQTMLDGARELARHHAKPTRFCPQAVTWLNQERFADIAAAAAVKAAKPPNAFSAGAEDERSWRIRLSYARLHGAWDVAAWGPMPHEAGCRAPGRLLEKMDGVGWAPERRAAS